MKAKSIIVNCLTYSILVSLTSSASKVFKVHATSHSQVEVLTFLQMTKLEFWTESMSDGNTEIFITEKDVGKFQSYCAESSIDFKVVLKHVEKINSKLEQQEANKNNKRVFDYDWNNYYSLDDINNWVVAMSNSYSDLTEMFDIGYSTEGRLMKVIRIGRPFADGKQKPAVFIDAGIHAREWISITTGTYFINQLLTNSNEYGDILNGLDIYFLPVVNPDGYEFTRNTSNPDNRMWKKTRSVHAFSDCVGVDGNRNYGFHWGEEGTSDDPCNLYYSGPSAFSEPETAALRDFILERELLGVDWNLYVTLHTKTQQILAPWGYTDDKPDNYAQHLVIGNAGADAIRQVHGTDFGVASSSENGLLSGNSRDWAKGSGIFEFSYTFELRNSTYGYLVPPELILPMAEESWAGMAAMLKYFIP